jgi:hypothetical protein
MRWSALVGSLVGAATGALVVGGTAAALSQKQHRGRNAMIGALGGAAVGGFGGAAGGQVAAYNQWSAANQACGSQVADWQTLACVAPSSDDTIPVNGSCVGIVPSKSLGKMGIIGGVAGLGAAGVAGLLISKGS